jgi:hypothetical protein
MIGLIMHSPRHGRSLSGWTRGEESHGAIAPMAITQDRLRKTCAAGMSGRAGAEGCTQAFRRLH